MLNDIVEIHPQPLNQVEVRKFIAKEHESYAEIEKSKVPFKVYLIVADEEQAPLIEG